MERQYGYEDPKDILTVMEPLLTIKFRLRRKTSTPAGFIILFLARKASWKRLKSNGISDKNMRKSRKAVNREVICC